MIVIIAEGEDKEEKYFKTVREIIRTQRVKIEVVGQEEHKSAPNFIEARINKAKKDYQLDEVDIVWLVFDKDKWEEHSLFGIPASLDKKFDFKIKLAVSNPCFEVWLMCHTSLEYDENFKRVKNCKQLKPLLHKLTGGFDISKLNFEMLCKAKSKAKNCYREKKGHPEFFTTQVFLVIEDIFKKEGLECDF